MQMQELLYQDRDIFAQLVWDMSGIPPSIITYNLNVDSRAKPVRQKKSKFVADRIDMTEKKVGKLLKVNYIRSNTPTSFQMLSWLKKPAINGQCV